MEPPRSPALRYGAPCWLRVIIASSALQEVEDARVDDSTLAETHVMTAA
jgi:hypothetical protein